MMPTLTAGTKAKKKTWRRGTLPVGTIRERKGSTRGDLLRMIKVRMDGPIQDRWMNYARWWWLKNRGPIPEGLLVFHIDGNLLNDAPENLALGTNGDVVQAAHRAAPAQRVANIVAMREGCREHNQLRGRIARATRWLGARWYPVDHAAQIIHNKPVKNRYLIWPEMGFDVPVSINGGSADSAALGWTGVPLLEACVLAALADGPLDGHELFSVVEILRTRRQEKPLSCKSNFYQALYKLRRDGLLLSTRRGKKPGMYRITPRAIEIRTRWTPIVPVHGRDLAAGACQGYTKVDEEMGLRTRMVPRGGLMELAKALAEVQRAPDEEAEVAA